VTNTKQNLHKHLNTITRSLVSLAQLI